MPPSKKIDISKIIGRLKSARTQIETLVKDRTWIEEAKKVAEKQGNEVKKILDSDVAKLKAFLEREKKELEKLQAQIPGEVDKLKKFVDDQKKELTKLLGTVKSKAESKAKSAKGAAKAKAGEAKAKATKAADLAKASDRSESKGHEGGYPREDESDRGAREGDGNGGKSFQARRKKDDRI